MKKFLLSLAALLTLGMASASAETIFDANFADVTYPANPDATTPGNINPSTDGSAQLTDITIGDYTFSSNGVQWNLNDGIAVLGTKARPEWYPYPAFIANNVVFENGNLINEIALTMYLQLDGSAFQELEGSLELYNDVTFSDLVGEAIPFTFELGLDAPKTFTISIPESYVSSGLYYKLNFNTVENSYANNSRAIVITDIKYNHAESLETVATPTFNPAGGEVEAGTHVAIECATEGATIYYTINGEDPTTESTPYEEAILIVNAMTIKAIAVKDGMSNSEIATAEYTISGSTDTPTLNEATFDFTNSAWLEGQGIDVADGDITLDDDQEFNSDYGTLTLDKQYADEDFMITTSNDTYLLEVPQMANLKFTCDTDWYLDSIEFEFEEPGELYPYNEEGKDGEYSDGTWTAGDENISQLELTAMAELTIKSITVKYRRSVGIDNIDVDAESASVYYNLQGVRVDNPEKGIYIVVKGNKATKQVF